MPELPEVENTRRGIAGAVVGARVRALRVRESRLRWPVPSHLGRELTGQVFEALDRRGKYLLFRAASGTAILHLGMSGSLRFAPSDEPPGVHDHVDFCLEPGDCLRYRDPRRFGALLWTRRDPARHPLLVSLGPEPLDDAFCGDHLYEASRRRRIALRDFLLDGRIVAGVGNIYANEAAFRAGILPQRSAGRISRARYARLAEALREVLTAAIDSGGTTLRDYRGGDDAPGRFAGALQAYGRDGKDCLRCGRTIRRRVRLQRSYYYCRDCQT